MPTPAVPYTKFSDKLTDSLNDINRMINENKEMIDSIQEVALGLTDAMGTLHILTVKYAGIANAILDALLPIVKNLPIIPDKITDLLVNLEAITQKIIDNSQKTSKTITDVNIGLKTGDVSKLKGHSGELKSLTNTLAAILPKK
jgi:hypothetical protein